MYFSKRAQLYQASAILDLKLGRGLGRRTIGIKESRTEAERRGGEGRGGEGQILQHLLFRPLLQSSHPPHVFTYALLLFPSQNGEAIRGNLLDHELKTDNSQKNGKRLHCK